MRSMKGRVDMWGNWGYIVWTAIGDVSVNMNLDEGITTTNGKRHDSIINNHRCEGSKPHNMGFFQIQLELLFQSNASTFT